MLNLDRNYVSIAPVSDEDDTYECLHIEDGVDNEELADRLEAFAWFLRNNPDVELSASID